VDDDALIDGNGHVNVVIGPEDEGLMEKARQAGVNYIPWGLHHRPMAILRNMQGEGEFTHSIQKVPVMSTQKPLDEQAGDLFIGEYSPAGYYCSAQTFMENLCEVKNYNLKSREPVSTR